VLADILALDVNVKSGRTKLCELIAQKQGDEDFMRTVGDLVPETAGSEGTPQAMLQPLRSFWGERAWEPNAVKAGIANRVGGPARLRAMTDAERSEWQRVQDARRAASGSRLPACGTIALGAAVLWAAGVLGWSSAQVGRWIARDVLVGAFGNLGEHLVWLKAILGMQGAQLPHYAKYPGEIREMQETVRSGPRLFIDETALPQVQQAVDAQRQHAQVMFAASLVLFVAGTACWLVQLRKAHR
jgi:hypothetical protein